jgi:hypothetical protein
LKIIASAAYCEQELVSELGLLPPSFLPVGNRRLFEHQLKLFSGETVTISLPSSFSPSIEDRDKLTALNAEVLYLPEHLSLGESIHRVLEQVGDSFPKSVELLFGDTLIDGSTFVGSNVLALAESSDNYGWHIIEEGRFGSHGRSSLPLILAGYFKFSEVAAMKRCLESCEFDFIRAIYRYDSEVSRFDSVVTSGWLDFGHVHTYFRSRSMFTTQRTFNSLEITNLKIKKSSRDSLKMTAERNWFSQLPSELKIFTPRILSEKDEANSYQLEYLYLNPLNELFVLGALPDFVWDRIMKACFLFLEKCQEYQVPNGNLNYSQSMYLEKSVLRLDLLDQQGIVPVEKQVRFQGKLRPALTEIVAELAKKIPNPEKLSIIHGDFCFSNILFDYRRQMVNVIDPRGLDANNQVTVYGDPRYDHAKLGHSIIGLYDFIVSQRFNLRGSLSQGYEIELPKEGKNIYLADVLREHGLLEKETIAAICLLFISMTPLHVDNKERQIAFLCNAFRLIDEYKLC